MPEKKPEIPIKIWCSWVSRGIPNFLTPPLHVFDPYPTGRYPDPKV